MKQELTPKQKKVVKGLKNNLLNRESTKTLKKIAIEAGYSEKTATNPTQKILNAPAVKREMTSFIKLLDEKAELAVNALTKKKIEKGTARDNAYVADIMVKNSRLLGGESTENQAVIQINISESVARKNA